MMRPKMKEESSARMCTNLASSWLSEPVTTTACRSLAFVCTLIVTSCGLKLLYLRLQIKITRCFHKSVLEK